MEYYSGIKDSGSTWMTKEEAFQELEKRGAAQAEVSFSGGHDSGGAESITLFRIEIPQFYEWEGGKGYKQYNSHRATHTIGRIHEHIWPRVFDDEGRVVTEEVTLSNGRKVTRPKERPLTEDEKAEMRLGQTLAAPIYDEFSSFAGEFSVEGVVTWLVKSGRIEMERSITVEQHDSGSYEVYNREDEAQDEADALAEAREEARKSGVADIRLADIAAAIVEEQEQKK